MVRKPYGTLVDKVNEAKYLLALVQQSKVAELTVLIKSSSKILKVYRSWDVDS